MSFYESCGAAEFGFTPAEFCKLVNEVAKRSLGEGANEWELERFIGRLHLRDLVLARTCARGHEGAWQEFLTVYREKLYAAAAVITREVSDARDLADSLYADLFGTRISKDGRRNSKFESYSGRGSLEGWLRTVLAQEQVNRIRREKKLVAFDDAIEARENATPSRIVPAEHLLLAKCTDAALEALCPEERFLLTAYYLDERTLAEIGRMLNVHESTVQRRIEKITSNLRKQILVRLRENGLSKRAAEEMLETDVRDLGVAVRDRLAQEKGA